MQSWPTPWAPGARADCCTWKAMKAEFDTILGAKARLRKGTLLLAGNSFRILGARQCTKERFKPGLINSRDGVQVNAMVTKRFATCEVPLVDYSQHRTRPSLCPLQPHLRFRGQSTHMVLLLHTLPLPSNTSLQVDTQSLSDKSGSRMHH